MKKYISSIITSLALSSVIIVSSATTTATAHNETKAKSSTQVKVTTTAPSPKDKAANATTTISTTTQAQIEALRDKAAYDQMMTIKMQQVAHEKAIQEAKREIYLYTAIVIMILVALGYGILKLKGEHVIPKHHK